MVRIIEDASCLPTVWWKGKLAQVRGTQYGSRRDGDGANGKYLDLWLIGEKCMKLGVHESNIQETEMPEAVVRNVCAMGGWAYERED